MGVWDWPEAAGFPPMRPAGLWASELARAEVRLRAGRPPQPQAPTRPLRPPNPKSLDFLAAKKRKERKKNSQDLLTTDQTRIVTDKFPDLPQSIRDDP
jgi:hypothetical protein